jgi:hypothetical protein
MEGLRRFVDAMSQLDAVFHRMTAVIPDSGYDPEEPDEVRALTLDKYRRAAPYFRDGVSAVTSSRIRLKLRAGFGRDTGNLIQHAKVDGFATNICWEKAGSAPMNAFELLY